MTPPSKKERRAQSIEWVGGRIETSHRVLEGSGFSPDILVWLEVPNTVIVGSEVVAPYEPDAHLGTLLVRSMENPLQGSPRRPDSIRVASAALVREVRSAIGNLIPIRVEPTPEVDAVSESLQELLGAEKPVYLGDGNIRESIVRDFFLATAAIDDLPCWDAFGAHLLRLDAPGYEVHGACISLIDGDAESSILIFPSRESCQAFWNSFPDEDDEDDGEPVQIGAAGAGWISLTFVHTEDVPSSLVEEANAHDWGRGGLARFPLLQRFEPDGRSGTLTEADFRLMTAVAEAISALGGEFGRALGSSPEDISEPTMGSVALAEGGRVYLSGPYEMFEIAGPRGRGLPAARPALTASKQTPERRRTSRYRHTGASTGFGFPIPLQTRKRSDFRPRVSRNSPCPCGSGRKYKMCCLEGDFLASETVHQRDRRVVQEMQSFAYEELDVTWDDVTDDFRDAETALELAAEWSVYTANVENRPIMDWYLESGAVQDPRDIQFIEAQQMSWLSVWEVRDVDPGESLLLHDPLTESEYSVVEHSASRMLRPGMHILARILEFEGESVICGMYPRVLLPLQALEVIERMQRRLRRKTSVPAERLRDFGHARFLLSEWEEQVSEEDERRRLGPRYRNAKGEIVSAEQLIEELKATMSQDPDDGEVGGGDLSPEAAREIVLSFKRRHYANWPDTPLPALEDATPREATRNPAGRRRVVALLSEMELMEQRGDPESAFDFDSLRTELGLTRSSTPRSAR